VYRNASRWIDRCRYGNASFGRAAEAMLRAKQGNELHSGRAMEEVDGARAFTIASGGIGNQPDPLARKQVKRIAEQYLDARHDSAWLLLQCRRWNSQRAQHQDNDRK